MAGSPQRNEAPAGMPGTTTGTGTAVVGDEVETCRGGGDDVQKTSVAVAIRVPTLALLLPNDTRRDCIDADEEGSWAMGDGGCCSAAAHSRSLRQFGHFRPNAFSGSGRVTARRYLASRHFRSSESFISATNLTTFKVLIQVGRRVIASGGKKVNHGFTGES